METVEVRVFVGQHPNAAFRLLPRFNEGSAGFISLSGRVTAEEGYADASMLCSGTAGDLQLTVGQRIAVLGVSDGSEIGSSARRVVIWEGRIARLVPSRDSLVPQFQVSLFGVWREAAKRRGMKRYINAAGDDLAVPFADLINRFVTTGPLASVNVITTLTGTTSWESLDAYDVDIAEAVRRLSLDSTRLVTGCDVGVVLLSGYDTYQGAPRLFLRPARSTSDPATHTILYPDLRTLSATS